MKRFNFPHIVFQLPGRQRTRLPLALAIIAALLFFSCEKDKPPVAEEVPVYQSYPVEKHLFGFNTGSTFYYIRPEQSTQNIAAHWLDSLAPRSFRFPGGRDANFYHHNAQAYGFKQGEFKLGHSEADVEEELLQEVFDKESNYPAGINVKEPFAAMANRQPQAASIFTVNIKFASYEENRDALQWLLAQGVSIGGIELGNELYLGIHRDTFPSPEAYIARAKAWTARFRSDFPGLKIGIVGAPVREDPTNGDYFKSWNDALAREDFFDAISWHHYVKFSPCAAAPDTWACLRDSMLRETQFQLPKVLDYWKQKFPTKKLWLSEWNLSAYLKEYIGSQAANLYFSAYLLQIARYSADNGGFITYAHHHNLLAGGLMALMVPDVNNPSFYDKSKRRPGFLSFAYLRDLFDGQTQWLKGTSLFALGDAPLALPSATCLHTTATGKEELMVVVVNPNDTENTLSWKQKGMLAFKVGNTRYSADFSGKIRGFYGAQLQSGQGGETELDRVAADFNGSVKIPARGVLVLRLPLTR